MFVTVLIRSFALERKGRQVTKCKNVNEKRANTLYIQASETENNGGYAQQRAKRNERTNYVPGQLSGLHDR